MKQNSESPDKRITEIQNEFSKLGITPDLYPKCEDMNSFGRRFKQCSVLKDVPTRITDNSDPHFNR
jgi:hypothetical protein